jgi:hypothetical protein
VRREVRERILSQNPLDNSRFVPYPPLKAQSPTLDQRFMIMQPDSAKGDAATETAITTTPLKPSPASTAYEAEGEEARQARLNRRRDDEGQFDKEEWTRQQHQRDEDGRRGKPARSSKADGGRMPVASVGAGILMMAIAAVWLFGAYYFRWNIYDPPILFAMGIITFIRGVMQRQ